MSTFIDDDMAIDGIRPVIDYVASLDPVEHRSIVMTAMALQVAMDGERYEAIASKVLAAFDRLAHPDRAGRASEVRVVARLEIAEALREAPDVGAAVLQVLIAQGRRSRDAGFGFAVPESLRPPAGTDDRLLLGYADAADLYRALAQAGPGGIAMSKLGHDLDLSRRSSAIRRLRLSDAVTESRVPNPGRYPASLIWLHAAGAS